MPVKTMSEYDMAQEVTVLFSETVHRLVIPIDKCAKVLAVCL